MHTKNQPTITRLLGFVAVAFLSVSLLLPSMAMAYGGGGGNNSRDPSSRPENNRVFDDETPSVPASHFSGDPSFHFNPAAIPDKSDESFWTSTEWIGLLQVLDVSGTIAGFFVPWGWPKALITVSKVIASIRDPAKRAKARSVLNSVKNSYERHSNSPHSVGVGYSNPVHR